MKRDPIFHMMFALLLLIFSPAFMNRLSAQENTVSCFPDQALNEPVYFTSRSDTHLEQVTDILDDIATYTGTLVNTETKFDSSAVNMTSISKIIIGNRLYAEQFTQSHEAHAPGGKYLNSFHLLDKIVIKCDTAEYLIEKISLESNIGGDTASREIFLKKGGKIIYHMIGKKDFIQAHTVNENEVNYVINNVLENLMAVGFVIGSKQHQKSVSDNNVHRVYFPQLVLAISQKQLKENVKTTNISETHPEK